MENLDFKFQQVVAFSIFEEGTPNLDRTNELLAGAAEKVTIADIEMNDEIRASARELDLPPDPVQIGKWASLYREQPQELDRRSLPDLEPFFAFGTAIEMALSTSEQ